MTRINSNVPSLRGLRNLQRTNKALNTSFQRLSTGLQINSGKDNPAGLIAGEKLRAQITAIEQSMKNSNRANNVIATADGALGEVNSLLNQVRGLVQEGLNDGALSQTELEANQLQIDSALSTINRIAANTTFAGDKLIDGSKGFITQLTAADAAKVDDYQVNEAQFGTSATVEISATVDVIAEKGQLDYSTGNFTDDVVLEISGAKGSQVLFFNTGTTQAQLITAINAVTDVTGVEAADNGGTVEMTSENYGESEFVDINVLSGTFATVSGSLRDEGVDISVTVNGQATQGKGLRASLKTSNLDASVVFDEASNVATTNAVVTVTGGGSLFQIGQEVSAAGQIGVGIDAVNTARLGGVTGKLYELGSGAGKSLLDVGPSVQGSELVDIIEEAMDRVSTLRGRLGAIQKNVIETNISTLGVALENITEARSEIVDTDFASETANLTRSQILSQAGVSVLSIANQNPQQVLSLLG